MRFGTWNISLYRAGSLVTVSKELSKYKLDLVGVQGGQMGGQWHRTSCRIHIFYRKGNANHELGTGLFCAKRIISQVKRVGFVSDSMSYIIRRGLFLLNVYVPTENKVKDSFYDELEHVFDKFPKYHTKILLGEFDPKIGREDSFKPTIGNESLHEISNDNFATSKNLTIMGTMFPHRNIHTYNWMSPDLKSHNQIYHILINFFQISYFICNL
jgi:hypothetical protein